MVGTSVHERISRLERRVGRALGTLNKMQRDTLVAGSLAEGNPAALLSGETNAYRRAAIEAAFRAGH
jgi:hypothetical protein